MAPRNKTVGVATFGVALLAAGVGVALNLSGDPYFSLQHVIGMTLGVVGIGLVIGAFLRGGRGLIGLAIPPPRVAVPLRTSGTTDTPRLAEYPSPANRRQVLEVPTAVRSEGCQRNSAPRTARS